MWAWGLVLACSVDEEPIEDADGDGVTIAGGDCDDDDPGVYPAAADIVGDGTDQNCDGVDGVDADQDGHASEGSGGADCVDADPAIYPGAEDTVGNEVDDDCDGVDGVDADQDGHASVGSGGGDCNDADPASHPGATEVWYDGVDQACDGGCDWDQDGDGMALAAGDGATDCAMAWDCDDQDALVGRNEVTAQSPGSGSTEAFYLDPIEATLQVEDATATLSVTDGSGGLVAGTSSVADATVRFVPDDPLSPSSAYDVVLEHACESVAWSFTTSDLGTPVTVDLADRRYSVDMTSGTVVSPAGIGPLVGSYLDFDVLLEVTDATDLAWLVGVAADSGLEQDSCTPTSEMDTTFSDPTFVTDPVEVGIPLQDQVIPVHDVVFSGTFASDGSTLHGLWVEGLLDTRAVVPLVDPDGDDDTLCSSSLYALTCQACPDTEPYCQHVRIESLASVPYSGDALVSRSLSDVQGDVACDGESFLCSSLGVGAVGLPWAALVVLGIRRRHRDPSS